MAKKDSHSQLRIIAGQWRSRRLPFAAAAGVRPTSDRIRETLFNWLQADIAGARCLDLFAGSGALGFEALSRAAAHVTFVDEDLRVIQQLQQNATLLETSRCDIVWQDAREFLHGRGAPYDIVFLDPPFRHELIIPCCQLLEQHDWLIDGARIYLESDVHRAPPSLAPNWQPIHDKQAGQVRYQLIHFQKQKSS